MSEKDGGPAFPYTENVRIARLRNGSIVLTLVPGLAADKGIGHGTPVEQRSFPQTEEEWQRIRREHPNALVLIPWGSEEGRC